MYSLLFLVLSFCFLIPSVFGHYPERYYSISNYVTPPSNYKEYVLPTDLSPESYSLTLTPHLENCSFSGHMSIQIFVTNATNKITMHTNPDYITNVTLAIISSQNLTIKYHQIDKTYELLTITLTQTMNANQSITLDINYNGILGNNMLGFYLTTYNTSKTTHLMGITQFESTYARRAFPCFDEPAYRAPFTISIYRTADQITMSNMNLTDSKPDNSSGLILDIYDTTPPIPTYLVAFGITDNKFVNSTDGFVTVFAREAAINDSAYVVKMGQSILDNIGNFVGVKYPLPKMDVVAVPDFDAGAMENWGLTTYREKYVLYNPTKNSLRDKFGVLSVIAHEFGHQWFGDLVTPDWWKYAWLNEAFATYFEYTVPNELEQNWKIGSTMYVVGAVQYALDLDIGSPRPMTSDVWTPSQIDNSFDYVIYEKGGSVLRMIENFLTTATWKQGLQTYLKRNEDKTGTPEKLFLALEQASKDSVIKDINNTLEGWTTQPGYPLINVISSHVGVQNTTYVLSQMPYAQSNTSKYVWNVPIVYTSQSELQFDPVIASKHWYYPSDNSSNTLVVNDNGWLLLNVDQIGYYRVNYDANNWRKLKTQMDSNLTVISDINRAQIIDDALHLARTGHLDYTTAFGLTNYLPKERALAPLNAFFVNMRFLINVFYNTSTSDGLQEYARRTMLGPFKSLLGNLHQDSFLDTTTLAATGLFSCEVGLSDCQSYAETSFNSWRKNTSFVIQPFVKQAVLCTGLQMEATVEAFQDVWKFYLTSDNAAEKLQILYAMGCITNTTAINTYLNAVTDTYANYIRLQDRWIAFRSLAGYQTGVMPVLYYLRNNYARASDALGPRISAVISTISEMIVQESQITAVNALLNDTTVDQRLKDQLASIVLPAIAKRKEWASSPQAASLFKWVEDNIKSSASIFITNIILLLIPALVLSLK